MTTLLSALHFLQATFASLLSGILLLFFVLFVPGVAWFWLEKSSRILATGVSIVLVIAFGFLVIPSVDALNREGCLLVQNFCGEGE